MGPSRRASIVDVAQRAGVAVGTVSNVLNRPDRVTEPIRQRVLAAIGDLDYVPSGAARQLRAGTITTVGAILLDIRNPFFTDVARGIEDRLSLDDHTLMLASSDDDPVREARYLRLFEQHGVFGVLVVPVSGDVEPLRRLQRRGVRVVLLDAPSTSPGLSSVAVDDRAGGRIAAQHLLGLGHDRVVMLNGPHSIRQCADRFAGAREAARAAGLNPDVAIEEVLVTSMDAVGGDEATGRLLGRDGRPPAAVFCVNDLVAFGVQRHLRRVGGTDMVAATALVGYDDIEMAAELAVPLTSVRQPTHEVGYRATEILLDGERPQHVLFQPELVTRASSRRA